MHVGHARQSGSGKSWTELSLERREDPERWFAVYAFKAGVRGDRVLEKRAGIPALSLAVGGAEPDPPSPPVEKAAAKRPPKATQARRG